MYWFEKKGAESDVFVSTRVRLARNLANYPFEPILCDTGAKEIIEAVRGVLTPAGYSAADMGKMSAVARSAAAERHLISGEMAQKKTPCELFEAEDAGVYIMVCEEDHLRIQAIVPGFDPDGAAAKAFAAEELLDGKLELAFDERLGYLTHCPTNLGTGMRVSVMMFLPALTLTNRIKALANQISKLGLTVRGTDGEGSASRGCLYQISNCVTLGATEEELLANIKSAAESIAETERNMRRQLAKEEGDAIRDRIMRSAGIAKYAYMIDTEELFRLYGDIRLGACMGFIATTPEELDSALISCLPAVITEAAGGEMTPDERDKKRARQLSEAVRI